MKQIKLAQSNDGAVTVELWMHNDVYFVGLCHVCCADKSMRYARTWDRRDLPSARAAFEYLVRTHIPN